MQISSRRRGQRLGAIKILALIPSDLVSERVIPSARRLHGQPAKHPFLCVDLSFALKNFSIQTCLIF